MSAKTALVVDDSKSARFALRKYLESHAFHVDTAESADEAFAFLKTHRPDLIFLDHVMPGTDGFEALRHLKADPQTGTIPVVICSSNEGADFTAEARNKGAADVLQKPPSPEQLGRILDNLQKLSQTLRQAPPKPAEGTVPSAAPSKVASIREPDVAIEQAVMKVIRSSLPGRPEPAAPAAPAAAFAPGATGSFLNPQPAPPASATPPSFAPPPPAPAAAFNPAATGSFSAPSASARPEAAPAQLQQLRDQVESRMKKITQDLFVQIAELKAAMATVESQRAVPEQPEQMLQAMDAIGGLDHRLGTTEARLGNLEARLAGLERGVEAQLSDLRGQIEAALQAQSERINQVAQAARAAAHEEAHAAAERTVMSAASRIADQLADSILKALGRG